MKPLLFLNIAWMRKYGGLQTDHPEGSFRFIREGGVPYEIFNFMPSRGRCYGYAPVQNSRINIQRLGAAPGVDLVNDVLVIWTASNPQAGGTYVVGWYNRATVFMSGHQRAVPIRTPGLKGPLIYNVVAPANACRVLALDERVFRIPRYKKGFPGIASAFFPEGTMPSKWVERIRRYIATGLVETDTPRPDGYPPDPELRARVEKAAIACVTRHYRKLHYKVVSREPEDLGWDLEARQGDEILRLEVKGRSSSAVVAELTPNEYKAMRARQYRPSYRLCIVTDALAADRTQLRIFAYDDVEDDWFTDELDLLNIKQLIGARVTG